MKINPQTVFALVAGILVGWFAAFGAMQCRMHSWNPEKKLEYFSRELGLSPEQKEKVAKVLAGTREKMVALRGQTRPQFEAIRRQSHEEIRGLLTENQKAKFEKLRERWEKKRRKTHEKWSG